MENLQNKTVLTGVKPTGKLHIGNYAGAIRPAIKTGHEVLSNGGRHFMFIADYHALNYLKDGAELKKLTHEIACVYLACGVDPNKTVFYRQSDIPEVFEMTSILTNFTPKGFMNKAHAYKAAVDKNLEKNEPQDSGINMGLYNYPILMAADILTYDTDIVPVGKDQVQHVEITADIAGAFNAVYGKEILKIPTYQLEEHAQVLPGTDGRKMSKSYNNGIPLFATDEEIKKAVMSIQTDCQELNAPKNPDEILLYQLALGFCKPEVTAEIKEGLEKGGMGYGTIKKMILADVLEQISPMREKYFSFLSRPDDVADMLKEGAVKARALATPVLQRVRNVILGR